MVSSLAQGFAERMRAVGGRVSWSSRAGLAGALAGLVNADRPVLVTPDLAGIVPELEAAGLQAAVGTRAATAGGETAGGDFEELLARAGTGVVGAIAGIASTGTVAVGPGGGNGGLLAAYPPHTVVLLEEATIRERLEEVLPEVIGRFAELGGEAVFISGPSRTADIEMLSVVGVHGPTGLDVLILTDEEA